MVKIKWHDYKLDPFPGCCQIVVLNRLRGTVSAARDTYEFVWAGGVIGHKDNRVLETRFYGGDYVGIDTYVDTLSATGAEYEVDLVFAGLLSAIRKTSPAMVYMSDNYHPHATDKHDGPVSIRKFVDWMKDREAEGTFPGTITLLQEHGGMCKDIKVWSLQLDYNRLHDFLEKYRDRAKAIYNKAVEAKKENKDNGSENKEPETPIETVAEPREINLDALFEDGQSAPARPDSPYYIAQSRREVTGRRRARR